MNAPGRWETITRTGTEFAVTWAPGLWAAQRLGADRATFDTFLQAVRWCAEQCGPDDEEPF